jgi:tetratricopeptide (TPR) repeat protein
VTRAVWILFLPFGLALQAGCATLEADAGTREGIERLKVTAPQRQAAAEARLNQISAWERAGTDFEGKGASQEAFQQYLLAFKALDKNAPDALQVRLREKVLRLGALLKIAAPEEATNFTIRAAAILKSANGNPDDLNRVLEEFAKAISVAPWWGDPYYNTALIEEQRGRPAAAIQAFKLYLLTEPAAQDADAVKRKIIELGVAAERPGGDPGAQERAQRASWIEAAVGRATEGAPESQTKLGLALHDAPPADPQWFIAPTPEGQQTLTENAFVRRYRLATSKTDLDSYLGQRNKGSVIGLVVWTTLNVAALVPPFFYASPFSGGCPPNCPTTASVTGFASLVVGGISALIELLYWATGRFNLDALDGTPRDAWEMPNPTERIKDYDRALYPERDRP